MAALVAGILWYFEVRYAEPAALLEAARQPTDADGLIAVTLCELAEECQAAVADATAVEVEQALARRGARLLYLPHSSPDLSPIEPCWSEVKTVLRKAQARTREALDIAITGALGAVTGADAQGWFRHCSYALRYCEKRSTRPSGKGTKHLPQRAGGGWK
jgi:transposase